MTMVTEVTAFWHSQKFAHSHVRRKPEKPVTLVTGNRSDLKIMENDNFIGVQK